MKRAATWLFYAVGALAIAYLALYAYVTFGERTFTPGDPIHIFRKPDAPELGQVMEIRREMALVPDSLRRR